MIKKILISVFIIITVGVVGFLGYSLGKRSTEQSIPKKTAEQPVEQNTPETISTPVSSSEATSQQQAKAVKAANVEQRDIRLSHTFYGTVVPYAEANVQGKYGGKIIFLKGKEGDNVQKGEVVVRFDNSDTQLELQRANASKNTTLESVKQAQSNFETAQADATRQEKLFEDGIVPKKAVDDSRNRLQSAQANLNSAREGVKQADAQINLLKNTLSDFVIAAPISGVINEKRYNLNEIYRTGDVIYHLVNINTIYVELEVPETYISQVKEKMNLQVFFDSLPDKKFSGIVDFIMPTSKAQSRNFIAKATVKNPERVIKPGMFARAEMSLKNISGALIVNKNALVEEGGSFYVFKIVDSKVKKVMVEITHRENGSVAVSSKELQAGDQIVIDGVNQLSPDEQVRIL